MKYIWPSYMKLRDDYDIHPIWHIALYTTTQHCFIYITGNILFYFIYTGKYQIFECQRAKSSEDEQWPWESMPKNEWRALLKRTLLFSSFNGLVMNNFTFLLLYLSGFPLDHPWEIAKMPSNSQFFA